MEKITIVGYDGTLEKRGNEWLGCVTLQGPNGPIHIKATACEDVEARSIVEANHKRTGIPRAEVGRRFGGRIKKAARKVARGKVVRKLRKGVQAFKNSPLGKAAIRAARMTPQGQAIHRGMKIAKRVRRQAKQITNTADRLARRDPRAFQALNRLARQAQTSGRSRALVGAIADCYVRRYGVDSSGYVVGDTRDCRGYSRIDMEPCSVEGVREGALAIWSAVKPRVGVPKQSPVRAAYLLGLDSAASRG